MLKILADMRPQPESVPINALVPIKGTPLENQNIIDSFDLLRVISTARIIMPKSRIRLSAGRKYFSKEAQMLCLLSGANSIFYGDNLLTTENNSMSEDKRLIEVFTQEDKNIRIYNLEERDKEKSKNNVEELHSLKN